MTKLILLNGHRSLLGLFRAPQWAKVCFSSSSFFFAALIAALSKTIIYWREKNPSQKKGTSERREQKGMSSAATRAWPGATRGLASAKNTSTYRLRGRGSDLPTSGNGTTALPLSTLFHRISLLHCKATPTWFKGFIVMCRFLSTMTLFICCPQWRPQTIQKEEYK